MKKIYLISFILFCFLNNHAQDSLAIRKNGKIVIGLNASTYNYLGDLAKFGDNTFNNQLAGDLYIGYKILPIVQLNLLGTYGKIYGFKHNNLIQHNFSTTLMGGGLNAKITGSAWLSKSTYKVIPYLNLGAIYYQSNVLSDLKNQNNQTYYYWSDGLIRNQPQSPENINTATQMRRDFTYETDYDQLKGFNTTFFAYKIGFGYDFIVNKFSNFYVECNYHFTNSDYLDGFEFELNNDAFYTINAGFEFNLKGIKNKLAERKDEKKSAKEINFDSLLLMDSDADGIVDIDDKCLETPSGTIVDEKGCPIDTDKDGIPDYMDEQNDTPQGMYVNEKGVGLSPEELEKIIPKDTVGIKRDEICKSYPEMCKVDENDLLFIALNKGVFEKIPQPTANAMSIEEIKKLVDINQDNTISKEELNNYILLYFKGKTPLKSYEIHLLVEHYFDQ